MFDLPEGMEVPEGIKAGDEFDVLATVKLTDGGKLQIVALDENPVSDEEEEAEEEAPAEKGFVERVEAGMAMPQQ